MTMAIISMFRWRPVSVATNKPLLMWLPQTLRHSISDATVLLPSLPMFFWSYGCRLSFQRLCCCMAASSVFNVFFCCCIAGGPRNCVNESRRQGSILGTLVRPLWPPNSVENQPTNRTSKKYDSKANPHGTARF